MTHVVYKVTGLMIIVALLIVAVFMLRKPLGPDGKVPTRVSNDTDASLENIKLDNPSEEDLKRSEEKLRQQAAEEERQKEAAWQKYVRGTDANGWHIYEDNERGFRISFPPGWDLGFFPQMCLVSVALTNSLMDG